MVRFTSEENARIERAVADAEHQTSAEIVLCVVEESDAYRSVAVFGAYFAGVLALTLLAIFLPDSHVRFALLVTLSAMFIVGLVLQWRPLRVALVPHRLRTLAASQAARLQFAGAVAGRTKAANGLLVFVSLAERHIEIVPDRAIAAKVPQATWEEIVAKLSGHVQREGLAEGLIGVVKACTGTLAQAFPYEAGDVNEIPDAVILPGR